MKRATICSLFLLVLALGLPILPHAEEQNPALPNYLEWPVQSSKVMNITVEDAAISATIRTSMNHTDLAQLTDVVAVVHFQMDDVHHTMALWYSVIDKNEQVGMVRILARMFIKEDIGFVFTASKDDTVAVQEFMKALEELR